MVRALCWISKISLSPWVINPRICGEDSIIYVLESNVILSIWIILKIDISHFYLKYLLLSLVTKLSCRYYVSVSTYPFPFSSLGISFFFNGPSCACTYPFIILIFKHFLGFFQWLSSLQGNLFQWNLFFNTILACI